MVSPATLAVTMVPGATTPLGAFGASPTCALSSSCWSWRMRASR
jgi:hypothetical protein